MTCHATGKAKMTSMMKAMGTMIDIRKDWFISEESGGDEKDCA